MPNLVYILTNPAMLDLIKIGKTDNIERRMKELTRHSGVPEEFQCYYCAEVPDNKTVEKTLRFAFAEQRLNPKREFFEIDPDRVKAIIELVAINDMTPSNGTMDNSKVKATLVSSSKRRPVFTFSMVDIPIGAELTFSKDKTKTVRVINDKKVEFDGEEYSLTRLARIWLTAGNDSKYEFVQGPSYFEFEGETVTERRIRLEDEQTD